MIQEKCQMIQEKCHMIQEKNQKGLCQKSPKKADSIGTKPSTFVGLRQICGKIVFWENWHRETTHDSEDPFSNVTDPWETYRATVDAKPKLLEDAFSNGTERPTERQRGRKCTQKSDRRMRYMQKNGNVKRKLNWSMRDLRGKLRRHMLKHNWIPSDNGPGGKRTPDRPWPTVLHLLSGTLTREKRNFPKKVILL